MPPGWPLPTHGERLEGRDQLLVIVDDGNAISFDKALERIIVADQGAGVRQRRPRAGRGSADLENDHRLAGGMNAVDGIGETVGIRDRFENQSDHRSFAVRGEPMQIIRPGDPVLAADGDDLRKAGRAGIDDRDRRGARLRDQGNRPTADTRGDAAGIDRGGVGQIDQAHAVGPVHQDAAAGHEPPQLRLLLGREAGGIDDRRPHAPAIEPAHDIGNACRRHGGQRHVHIIGKRFDGGDRGQPGDLGCFGMDGYDPAGEFVVREIVERDVSQRLAFGRSADDRDGARPDQRVHEIIHCVT